MKKYKLLKWYPGLPESWKPNEMGIRNSVTVEEDLPRNRYISKGSWFFVRSEIENNPEFWKEIVEPVRKFLYTTEDGVDLYEGDTFYVVDDRNQVIELQAITGTHLFMTDVLFSTKEKAEHYKLMNKKCLSVNQVMKKFCRNTVTMRNNLINIAKNET